VRVTSPINKAGYKSDVIKKDLVPAISKQTRYIVPFLTRWSLVRLCRHVALARPWARMRPMVAANLSL
jgi:hypothetical protein